MKRKRKYRPLAERRPQVTPRGRDQSGQKKLKRDSAKRRRARISELKKRPCADCGGTFDPVCMDFDHRPGEPKIAGVSAMASFKKMLAEAEKCDVVCANCHRIRTFRKRDHGAAVIRGQSGREPDVRVNLQLDFFAEAK